MVKFQAEKGKNSSTKMVPFQKNGQKWYHFSQKMVKIPQQKWYHFRKGSKILIKNSNISENGQKSSTKMVPFLKRVIIPQKWYHFRKGSKILNKNGTISEKGQNPQQKCYHSRKW